jgi:hypothetical protein
MQMQIETRKPDPTDDRSAFIGSVLACFLVLAGLVVADRLVWPDASPHHLTQDEGRQPL